MTPRSLLITLIVPLLVALAPASGARAQEPVPTFAALQITPFGDQEVDFATGVTTLPQGGTVSDAEAEVTLRGDVIRFKEGSFLEADGAEVEGTFGSLRAEHIRIDLTTDTLTATGGLTLTRRGLAVEAQELTYFAAAEVVRFAGEVRSEPDPTFTAAAMLLDAHDGSALLIGPYRFADGPFTLNSETAGTLLELHPSPAGEEGDYAASSQVSPAVEERLGGYIP